MQLNSSKKASSPILNNIQSIASSPLSKDLNRAIISQLSILITNLNSSNYTEVSSKIDSILNKYQEAIPTFLRRLINQSSAEILESESYKISNSYNLKVLRNQLKRLTSTDLNKVKFISEALLTPESQFVLFSLEKFLAFFELSNSESLLISLSIEEFIVNHNLKEKNSSLLKELPDLYIKYSAGFIEWLSLLESTNTTSKVDLLTFLKLFLNSEIFSVPHKFIVLTQISKTFKSDNTPSHKANTKLPFQTNFDKLNTIINKFLDKVRKMSIEKLVLEFCNTKSSPERLLTDLLSIQPEENIDAPVWILLSETLLPGFYSKKVNNNEHTSSNASDENTLSLLTADTLPEATARGSRMLQVIKKFKDLVNWDVVFTNIISNWDQGFTISAISLSQFLSSINSDKLIDQFIMKVCESSKIPILSQLLIQLNSLDPNVGAIDIFRLNLKPILETETNSRNLLLYYKSITMLEVKTVSLLSFKKINDNIVSQIFNKDLRIAPEYMILACLHLQHRFPKAEENDIIVNIMQNFFINLLDANSPYLTAVFALFEELNGKELGRLLLKYLELRKNPENIHKVASLTASFKDDTVVQSILSSCTDFHESFTIAVVFSQYGWKHFKQFILDKLEVDHLSVLTTILNYLETQARIEYENTQQGKKDIRSLNIETIYFLMTALSTEKLPKELFERTRNLQTLCLQAYPRLINFGQGHDSAIMMNGDSNSFSIEVEKEMKLYYQRMYKKEIEIKDVVLILQKLKNSDNPYEQDVFACMIHSLLDEYRFFPEYPVDALATTSVLFGNAIVSKLLEGPALSIALRYILESAREPMQSKMFKFAVQALYSFMKRLPEFPKFCSILCEIESLKYHTDLYELCKLISSGKPLPPGFNDEPVSEDQGLKNNVLEEDVEIVSKYASITIPDISYNVVVQEVPPKEVSDRILFMVNNVSENNLTSRIDEMKGLLTPNHHKWFAKYLVNQRAKLELNNQHIYATIVGGLKSQNLYSYVVIVTIRQMTILLNKTVGDSNQGLTSSEKNHLKNLGSWLGRISLANDHPILRKDISFKNLLVEGYHQRSLEYVTPLVCKVLDHAKSSKVFCYPNPWLLGILQVLKELYEIADLKLTLKFEIEVLCNELNIKLDHIESSHTIRNSKPEDIESLIHSQKLISNMTAMALNPKRGIPAITPTFELSSLNGSNSLLLLQQQQQQQQQLALLQQLQQQRLLARSGIQNSPVVSNLTPLSQQTILQQQAQAQTQQQSQQVQQPSQQVQAFDNLLGETVFVTHPALKRIFQLSLAKAVKDLLPPLVHRTNTVCVVTTKALIQKDFAFEVDETKFRKAYINTIRHFADHLIIASSADLVRDTIQSNIHQYLQVYVNDAAFAEQIPIAVNDNLNLALSIIQKATIEKAVSDMDEAMLPALALRRQFSITSPNQLFCDTQNASKYAMSLPEPLGIKPGGVNAEQFRIYEEFGKGDNRLIDASLPRAEGVLNPAEVFEGDSKEKLLQKQLLLQQQQQLQQQQLQQQLQQQQLEQMRSVQPQLPPNVLEQSIGFINQHFETIIKATQELSDKDLKLSSDTSEIEPIKNMLMEIVQTLTRLSQQKLYLEYAQMSINTLFSVKEPSQLFVDVFVFLIGSICDSSPFVVRFISTWLFHSADERKLNPKILKTFILEGFISLSDISYAICKHIEVTKDSKWISAACDIISDFVFGAEPIALRSDFIQIISLLERSDDTIKNSEKVQSLFKKLESSGDDAIKKLKNGLLATSNLKEYIAYMFSEWTKIYKFSGESKLQLAFMSQLVDSGIFNTPDLFAQFFTVATEVCVDAFVKETDNLKRASIDSYTAVDSLAKLVIILLSIQSDETEDNKKRIEFFTRFCSVFILAFSNDHEINKASFNERPYFRFFSTLLSELSLLKNKRFKPYAITEADEKKFNCMFKELYKVLADILLCLQPTAFPGFTYAWICLISHRMFMPMILELGETDSECSEKFCSLLVALLRFESGFVKGSIIPDSVNVIYKGTIRVFTVLLHDFPEFLAQWFNPLLSATSFTFIQLRNIISSAVPFDIKVPDPFQPGLKVDRLPETYIAPVIGSDPSQPLLKKNCKKTLDNYLRIPSNSLLRQLLLVLELNEPVSEGGIGFRKIRYDIPLINSLVLYTCISYVEERSRNNFTFNPHSSQVSLLVSLMQEGDVELQFLILQAIANNLRYPNSHTHWFSCVVLHFFSSKNLWGEKKEDIQQLITRVLLEKIICNKPHPWGLLVTFIELLKNKDYDFSNLSFTKITPAVGNVLGALISHANSSNTAVYSDQDVSANS